MRWTNQQDGPWMSRRPLVRTEGEGGTMSGGDAERIHVIRARAERDKAFVYSAADILVADRLDLLDAYDAVAAQLAQAQQERESLRAQFAAFADLLQQVQMEIDNGAREWGHMRSAMTARLSVLESTARKMAAGQPAYVPTYKLRAEAAEATLAHLQHENDELKKQLARVDGERLAEGQDLPRPAMGEE